MGTTLDVHLFDSQHRASACHVDFGGSADRVVDGVGPVSSVGQSVAQGVGDVEVVAHRAARHLRVLAGGERLVGRAAHRAPRRRGPGPPTGPAAARTGPPSAPGTRSVARRRPYRRQPSPGRPGQHLADRPGSRAGTIGGCPDHHDAASPRGRNRPRCPAAESAGPTPLRRRDRGRHETTGAGRRPASGAATDAHRRTRRRPDSDHSAPPATAPRACQVGRPPRHASAGQRHPPAGQTARTPSPNRRHAAPGRRRADSSNGSHRDVEHARANW